MVSALYSEAIIIWYLQKKKKKNAPLKADAIYKNALNLRFYTSKNKFFGGMDSREITTWPGNFAFIVTDIVLRYI